MWYCIASHMLSQLNYIQAAFHSHHLFAVICARAKLNMWRFYITAFNISALFTVLMCTYTACVYDLHLHSNLHVGLVVRWFFISSEGLKFLFNTCLLCYFRCRQYDSWLCTLIVRFPVLSSKQNQVSRPLHANCLSLYVEWPRMIFCCCCILPNKSKDPGLNLLRQLFVMQSHIVFSPFPDFLF